MSEQTHDDFFENRKLAEQNRLKNRQVRQDISKKKLMGSVKTKIKTTMIGAIAAFEETFGTLWGRGLNEAVLTDAQKQFRQEWDKVRTKVLNIGNNQIRNSEEEISQYELNRKQETITFLINKEEQPNG